MNTESIPRRKLGRMRELIKYEIKLGDSLDCYDDDDDQDDDDDDVEV